MVAQQEKICKLIRMATTSDLEQRIGQVKVMREMLQWIREEKNPEPEPKQEVEQVQEPEPEPETEMEQEPETKMEQEPEPKVEQEPEPKQPTWWQRNGKAWIGGLVITLAVLTGIWQSLGRSHTAPDSAYAAEVQEQIISARHDESAREQFLNRVAPDAQLILRDGPDFEMVLNYEVADLFADANREYLIGETHQVTEVRKDESGRIKEIILEANP